MERASVSGRGGHARVQQVICVADHRPGPGLPAQSVTATGIWAAWVEAAVLSRDLYLGSLHSHDCSPLLPLWLLGVPGLSGWQPTNVKPAGDVVRVAMPR